MTDFQLREINEKVIADVKVIDSGYVGISDGDVDIPLMKGQKRSLN